MKTMRVKLTLTEEMLGTTSANKDLHEAYIASKAPDAKSTEEEIAALGETAVIEKSMTIFPKEDGRPFLWDYQVKGFFKDAVSMLRNLSDMECSKIKNYKKKLDGLLFIEPRRIMIGLAGEMGNCQRPLRADTMQGPRVAIAHSETVPAGSEIEFNIKLMDESLETAVRECLDYGADRGIGQWRNSGKGRFVWQEIEA